MTEKELYEMKVNIAYQAIKIRSLMEALEKLNPDLLKEWDTVDERMQHEQQKGLSELLRKSGQ